MNYRRYHLWFSGVLIAVWVGYGLVVLRQVQQLKAADPVDDTGLSFGHAFLLRFCGPALLLLTVLVCIAGLLIETRARRRDALQKGPEERNEVADASGAG